MVFLRQTNFGYVLEKLQTQYQFTLEELVAKGLLGQRETDLVKILATDKKALTSLHSVQLRGVISRLVRAICFFLQREESPASLPLVGLGAHLTNTLQMAILEEPESLVVE